MFEKVRTVLVLGAGASCPFKLPTASELRRQIIGDPPSVSDQPTYAEKYGMTLPSSAIGRHHQWASDFRQCGGLSIDRFLEERNDRSGEYSSLLEWGRFAIASKLLPLEAKAVASRLVTDDWHAWLFSRMLRDRQLMCRGLSVITFNYDRTFEIGMSLMLARATGIDVLEAWKRVQSIPIHHVYGALAAPAIEDMLTRGDDFAAMNIRSQTCANAAAGISIADSRGAVAVDSVAAGMLEDAQLVIALGIGYDLLNLRRIGLTRERKATICPKNQKLFGSAFDLRDGERKRAEHLTGADALGEARQDCLGFLRSVVSCHEPFISY